MVRNTYEVQNLGDLLREKRKKLQLDIKQVADDTKIRAEYIIALEAGDFAKFPANVYAKGFLKKYAKYLGISPERAAAMYRRENSKAQKDALQSTDFIRQRFKTASFTFNTNNLITAVIILLIVGFAGYIIYTASSILQNPALEITAPVTGQAGNSLTYITDEEILKLEGEVEIGSTLALNGSEVNVNNLQQFELNDLPLNVGENRFQLVAKSQLGRKSVIDLLVIRNESHTAEQPSIPNNSSNGNTNGNNAVAGETTSEMKIEVMIVNRDAYVQVEIDGQPHFAQVMAVNSKKEFTAKSTLSISSPRFDAVQLSVNGQEFLLQSARVHEFKLVNGQVQLSQL